MIIQVLGFLRLVGLCYEAMGIPFWIELQLTSLRDCLDALVAEVCNKRSLSAFQSGHQLMSPSSMGLRPHMYIKVVTVCSLHGLSAWLVPISVELEKCMCCT